MKRIFLFSVVISLMIAKVVAQPIVSAPTPPVRSASNVISIFSGAYTDISGTNFNPNWGQSGFGSVSEITIGGTDIVKKYGNMNYQGWEFSPAISAASMTNLHLDIWSSDCTSLDVYLIDFVAPEQKVAVPITASGWTSVDIPLSSYTRPITNVGQFKFVSTPGGATVYLDNVYFWTAATLPTITGFSVPAKVVGDAPFTITNPASNSAGAFSYSSSNPSVATVSGNTVTITGSGTSTITVLQAASGIYASGSATTSLVVTYNPPTVAAPTPATPSANVISLFSNAYTNRTIDTWSASWDQADVSDLLIEGNDTKLYTNLNYSGIEFTGANVIDATSMLYYHVDVWTPNSTPIKVKLVDFGANGSYDGGDDVASIEYVLSPAPTPGVWSSYNIPLADFTGLTTKAHLAQMLFVGSSTTFYVDNIYLSSIPTTFSPLPVTLADFKASKRNNTTVLSWKTLSEINSKGFSLERSANGINWAPLQFINENGASNATKQYATVDNNPLKGTNYYRLVQVDIDGKQNYSSIVSVNFTATGATGFSFYPNPAKNSITVALETIDGNAASLQLMNAAGKTVKTMALSKQNSNSNIMLDIANLNKGVYILLLRDRETVKTSKLVIN